MRVTIRKTVFDLMKGMGFMKKYVLLSASIVMSAAMMFNAVNVKADEGTDNTASAGVKVALDSTDGQKIKSENKTSYVMAGIAVALNNYYSGGVEKSDATLEGLTKIFKHAQDVQAAEQKADEQQSIPVPDCGYNVLGVANVENYLNVREEPSLDGAVLGKLPMNAGCEILETLDGWYKVSSGAVEGYVSAEFLLTGDEANKRAAEAVSKVATVNADKLMVREEPNTDCAILNRVAQDEDLEVEAVLDGWVQVNVASTTGYVCADYVTVHDALPKGVTLEQLSEENGDSAESVNVVEYAKQFLGNPYVWGGTSLTNGCDCSGFTMRIFEHFGYSLNRTSGAQSSNGTRVSLSEIQPGDLLFYSYGGSIGHVAIYIGGGQIIHASTEKTGICIGNAFFMTPTCATRIIG